MNGDFTPIQTINLRLIDIHTDHVIADFGKTSPRHQAYIAGSKNRDFHNVLLLVKTLLRKASRLKPTQQIIFNIIYVLETHRNPNQSFGDPCGLSLMIGETTVGGRCRVGDRGFDVT